MKYGEIDSLVEESQKGNSQAAEILVKAFAGLIHSLVGKYSHRALMPPREFKGDLEGKFILLLSDFNLKRGVYFSKYIESKLGGYAGWLGQRVQKEQRRQVPLVEPLVHKQKSYFVPEIIVFVRKHFTKRDSNIFSLYYEKDQTQKEIGETMKLTQGRISEILKGVRQFLWYKRDKLF